MHAHQSLRLICQKKQFLCVGKKQLPMIVRHFAEGEKQKKAKKKQDPKSKVTKGGDDNSKRDEAIHKFIDSADEVKR